MASTLDLFVNLSNPVNRALLANSGTLSVAPNPQLVVRDNLTVRIRFFTVEAGARSPSNFDPGAGVTVAFGAKTAAAFQTETTFLFYSASFTRDATDPADVFFTTDVNLNTTEFIAAFGTSPNVGQSIAIRGEIELEDDGSIQTAAQFAASGLYDVIRGAEPSPTAATPPYPVAPVADTLLGGNSDGTAWITYPISASLVPRVVSGNATAVVNELLHVTATATISDPASPVQGRGFTVVVRNGTATVGGVAYATAGTVVRRVFHSGAYTNYVEAPAASQATVDAGTDAIQPVSPLTLHGYVNPLIAARAPLSGVQFTGVGSVIGTIPNGAAQFGLGDFGLRAQVLRSATATANALARSHASGNNRVELRTTTGNALILRFVDGSGSNTDYTFPTYTLPLNTPAAMHVVADRDGNAVLYDNGVSVATISIAASAAVDIGSGNTALADVVGAFLGTIQRVEWLNVALTAAEVALLHAYGWAALPQYVHRGGAGQVVYTSDFSAGAAGWVTDVTFGGSAPTGNIDTDADGAGVPPSNDWLRLKRNTGVGAGRLYSRQGSTTFFVPVIQKAVRLAADLFVPTGSGIDHVSLSSTLNAPLSTFTTTPGAVASVGAVVVLPTNLNFSVTNSVGVLRTDVPEETALYLKNIVLSGVGLCGSWTFDGTGAGYQERDRSGGRRPLLLTTTGVSRLQRGDRIQVTATVAHGGAGNLQITGQSVLPDLGWRLVAASAKADANVTIQVGNVSGGAQIVGSVALTSGTLTALTIASTGLKPTTVNAWSNASTAANVQYSLVYERDDIV